MPGLYRAWARMLPRVSLVVAVTVVMALPVAGDPNRARPRRACPTTGLPRVASSAPTPITCDPHEPRPRRDTVDLRARRRRWNGRVVRGARGAADRREHCKHQNQ